MRSDAAPCTGTRRPHARPARARSSRRPSSWWLRRMAASMAERRDCRRSRATLARAWRGDRASRAFRASDRRWRGEMATGFPAQPVRACVASASTTSANASVEPMSQTRVLRRARDEPSRSRESTMRGEQRDGHEPTRRLPVREPAVAEQRDELERGDRHDREAREPPARGVRARVIARAHGRVGARARA